MKMKNLLYFYRTMKFVVISDTHGLHDSLELPPGDVLIHAGDVSKRGYTREIKSFVNWFAVQPHPHKIFIAGNHDYFFEQKPQAEIEAIIPPNVIYLNDSGIELNGIRIWGSPIQPWYCDWAFNRQRGPEIRKHWDLIPADTDILITHGPPFGFHDRLITGMAVGCEELTKKVWELKPKIHIFGHIHEAYGESETDGVRFINAAVLNFRYEMQNAPIVFDWD